MDDTSDLPRRLAGNLAHLRKERGCTQAVLARHSGVPRSTIASLEAGGGNPSLRNLAALAAALRVGIEELLARPRADCSLQRAAEIPLVERGHGSVRLRRLLPDSLPGLQVERMEILPRGFMRGAPHVRGAKEYLVCLSGTVRLSVAGRDFDLTPGDVLAFPGDQPHSYQNPGRLASAALSVVALTA
jgi:transcriptional regulator with XRE-family HTH domain